MYHEYFKQTSSFTPIISNTIELNKLTIIIFNNIVSKEAIGVKEVSIRYNPLHSELQMFLRLSSKVSLECMYILQIT